jgi:hypothetical protein
MRSCGDCSVPHLLIPIVLSVLKVLVIIFLIIIKELITSGLGVVLGFGPVDHFAAGAVFDDVGGVDF